LHSVARARHSRTRVCARHPRQLVQLPRRWHLKCNHTTHATPASSAEIAHFFHFVKDRTALPVKNQKQTY
jgi:hypothetical protein